MSEVLVIGAGVNGLVAATYLARAGAAVTVLEAGDIAGGVCANRVPVGNYAVPAGPHAFSALDPRVLKDLELTKRLVFVHRDLPLTFLRDGEALAFPRDVHETERALARQSAKDAAHYPVFRRSHFGFARAMRSLWWEDGAVTGEETYARLRRLQVTSALALIDENFESESARAAFAFDALATNPSAPGSALVLAWAAAQEMCGLQGAVAVPLGGPAILVDALVAAATAAGVDIRFNAEVARLDLAGEAIRGAVLTSGETVEGRTVLSCLSRKKTLLEFLPPGAAGFAAARKYATVAEVGEAKLVLALKACPAPLAHPARYGIGERLENVVLSYAEARAGRIPSDLYLEAVVIEPGEPPEILLSIRIRPVPVAPAEGWKSAAAELVPAVVRMLERQVPGVAAAITAFGFVPPAPRDALCLADLVEPWRTRIATPVRGLYLCGAAAEPVPCVSGRAGRIAAAMIAAEWERTP
ncbi:phytoene desaturase family protein [Rhizomicrobium electricum]|uniref:Pyridine nucleotide-disulfide oxidoreductase domain-containing protein 2 n=1 Tax=Rhizomicrobium electricum TaxID=480070 RepID=A0ABN1FAI7_9PROT|nr:NAD(P)/FAD-dependent oxidoreductase [Rhizomicrobium electricum]NIJ50614.1 phytoene dehydrogenase-like protein [Rhizomicrobium electricum]